MRVTVIVPLFNKARYVRRCLESVLAQTLEAFEVIVVNDGSTDGSERALEGIHDPRVRVLHQENAGPGAARNRGIQAAGGEFLAFLDADDEWFPEYLESSVRALEETPDAASVTSSWIEEPSGRNTEAMWRRRGLYEGPQRITARTNPAVAVQMLAFMHPCATLARKDVIRTYGGFYEQHCLYAEDAHLWLQVLFNHSVLFQMDSLVRIHRDAAELSGNLDGCRPVEPFLLKPELVRATCPHHLRPVLDSVIAARAFKTACVLAYWGDWRGARKLREQFAQPGSWRLPYALPSFVLASPAGAALCGAWRAVSRA